MNNELDFKSEKSIDFSTEKDIYKFTEFIASCGQEEHVLKSTSQETAKVDFSTEKDGYKYIKFIASGGQGHVLKAISQKTNKTVGVKKFNCSPDEVDLIMNEIKITQSLQHPHIVPIIDVVYKVDERTGGEIAYVMPFCEIGNLADLKLPLSKKRVFQVMYQLASALEYIHEKNIIHRDLKPQNILIEKLTDDEISILLADFGFSRNFEISRTMTVLGTLGYMSPEMIQTGKYGSSTDIYSFGCILFELITGKKFFQHEKSNDKLQYRGSSVYASGCIILERIIGLKLSHAKTSNDKITFPKEYHTDFTKFILRMLSNDPTKRPTAKMIKDFVKPFLKNFRKKYPQKTSTVKRILPAALPKNNAKLSNDKKIKLKATTIKAEPISKITHLDRYDYRNWDTFNDLSKLSVPIKKSIVKILTAGNSTMLLSAYVHRYYGNRPIDINDFKHSIQFGNNNITLEIKNTTTPDLVGNMISGTDVGIMVADVTCPLILDHIKLYFENVKFIAKKILVATCDAPKEIWKVSHEILRYYAKLYGCVYIPTNSKQFKNVDLVFNVAAFMGTQGVMDNRILGLNENESIDDNLSTAEESNQ